MAVIVLASASGSPGVSTTALGLTLNWHRPVLLVDADPTGSSSVFAGYFHGTQEPTGGLINSMPRMSVRTFEIRDAAPRA
jgi:cellulose biosynthesis protein BcsQ